MPLNQVRCRYRMGTGANRILVSVLCQIRLARLVFPGSFAEPIASATQSAARSRARQRAELVPEDRAIHIRTVAPSLTQVPRPVPTATETNRRGLVEPNSPLAAIFV